jgi:DNA-binding MarR family transcriptional regulator
MSIEHSTAMLFFGNGKNGPAGLESSELRCLHTLQENLIPEQPMNVEKPSNCTCLNLRKAARLVTQLYDESLKPCGLRSTQFSVLSVVQHKGPLGIADLAALLDTDRTTLTRNRKPLFDRSLTKVIGGEDVRRKPVSLTATGVDQMTQATPFWQSIQRDLVSKLGQPRWEDLLSDLTATTTAVHQM